MRRLTILATLALAVLFGAAIPLALPDSQARAQDEPLFTEADLSLFHTVLLRPGWNLVSWSGDVGDGADVAASITGGFTSFFTFDSAAQDFRFLGGPGQPTFLNTLQDVQLGDGVWVFVKDETTWVQPQARRLRAVDLVEGFNLVAWTGPDNTPIETALAPIAASVNRASTYDAAAQQFRSWAPGRPDFLNTASLLNYGDGVWIDATAPAVWDQPAPAWIHTQDVWFFTALTRRDADGVESDYLPTLTAALAGTAGDPRELPLNVTLRPAPGLSGTALDETGAPIPSIRLDFATLQNGVVVNDTTTSLSVMAPAFFASADTILIVYSTPHLEEALRNFDADDQVVLDLSTFPGLEPGDTLLADLAFGQLLAPADRRDEDGLSALDIFETRWRRGDLRITGSDRPGDAFAVSILRGLALPVTAPQPLATAALRVTQATAETKWTAKVLAGSSGELISEVEIDEPPDVFIRPFGAGRVLEINEVPADAELIGDPLDVIGARVGIGDGGNVVPDPPTDSTGPKVTFLIIDSGSGPLEGWLDVQIIITDSGGVETSGDSDISVAPGTYDFTGPDNFPLTSVTDIARGMTAPPTWERTAWNWVNPTSKPVEVSVAVTIRDSSGNLTEVEETFVVPPRLGSSVTIDSIGASDITETSPYGDSFRKVKWTVIVVDGSGAPAAGKRVAGTITDANGDTTKTEVTTDSNGIAMFMIIAIGDGDYRLDITRLDFGPPTGDTRETFVFTR